MREEAGRSSIASSSSSRFSARLLVFFIIYLIKGPLAHFLSLFASVFFAFPPEILFCFFLLFRFVTFFRSVYSFYLFVQQCRWFYTNIIT